MSNQIIKIKCDFYLIRFLESIFGPQPIKFPKSHNFNNILSYNLGFIPPDYQDPDFGNETLLVELPYFENKDPRVYNYLSPKQQKIFRDEVYCLFKLTFRTDITKILLMQFKRQKKRALEMFIDKYNIPLDCWDMLDKDYSRHIQLTWKKKKRVFR
ncbi:MAG: hypothetical protein ABSE72_12420 [Bacteroidales bacterium]|jgi:hypothetical protein